MPSKHAALIYTMVLVSASDRDMTGSELRSIGNIVERLPVFEGYDTALLPKTSAECAEMLAAENGLDATLDTIKKSLPGPLRETAFALAVEIAAADHKVELEEMRLLKMVRERLEIDDLAAAAIERSARARYTQG
jgi:tellurite resistance protein